ncbi:unnamed protein product, partial [Heterotrigona itama]
NEITDTRVACTRTAWCRSRGSVDASPCSSMLCCVSRRAVAATADDHSSSIEQLVSLEEIIQLEQSDEPVSLRRYSYRQDVLRWSSSAEGRSEGIYAQIGETDSLVS